MYMFFPSSSAGKESICNAGNPGSIPGLGRSPGEGIGCPLQYSWASLVAQYIGNLPGMQETWAQSLGWEDTLEEGIATPSNILAWRIPMDRGVHADCTPWGRNKSDMTEWLSTHVLSTEKKKRNKGRRKMTGKAWKERSRRSKSQPEIDTQR